MRILPRLVGALLAATLAACAAPVALSSAPASAPSPATASAQAGRSPSASSTSATPDTTASAAKPSSTSPASTPSPPAQPLAGKVIVVDPGHNAKYTKSFNTRKVPAGNGKTKACNSSGTAGKGLSEHAYTWAQAKLLRDELQRLGAKVILTRSNDKGQGPCVDKRAKVANDAGADLLISLHADGSLSQRARGFHVIISTTMAGGSRLEQRSKALATNVRTALGRLTSMPRSTYIGKGTALSPRSDIATLNLLEKTPGIMLEIGNMRHAKDLALLKSTSFRTKVAKALAQAAVATLN